MAAKDLKGIYGEEYPDAVIIDRVRLPLSRETRFSRSYRAAEPKMGAIISRFMDGSATIALADLQLEWPTWTESERTDFCQNCAWIHGQSDFPDMLRFIMKHGDSRDWSGIASSVASSLPADEAYDTLQRALQVTEIGRSSNIAQAIALTKHRDAEVMLRKHLQSIWAHELLWNDDQFLNWVAFDATTGIAHLIELGAAPGEFADQVRQLSEHVCSGNRDSCQNFLSKHYQWLQ